MHVAVASDKPGVDEHEHRLLIKLFHFMESNLPGPGTSHESPDGGDTELNCYSLRTESNVRCSSSSGSNFEDVTRW